MGKWWWVSAVLLGCGGASVRPVAQNHAAPAATAPETKPAPDERIEHGDLAVLDQREIGALPKRALHAGTLTASVEAAADPTVDGDEKATHVVVPLGGSLDTIDCYVYPGEINPGNVVMGLVKAVGSKPDISITSVRSTDVAVAHERAVMFVDARYVAKRPGGNVAGLLKLGVYIHPKSPMLCMQDQIGYHQTFKRVVTGFADTLRVEGAEGPPARFVEIDVDRIDGNPVGYTRVEVTDGDNGTKNYLSMSTGFLPRSATDVIASDSARLEVWEPSGYVSLVSYAEVEGGDMSEKIVLKRKSAHAYTYEGTHAGKHVAGEVTTKGAHGFESDILLNARTKKIAATGGETHYEGYHPDEDPTAPTDVLVRAPTPPDGTVTAIIGKVQMKSKVDDHGRLVDAQTTIGQLKFTNERVMLRGSY